MPKFVYEILGDVAKASKKADKIAILQKHQKVWAMRDILLGTFSDKYQFNLPKGEPPYTPNDGHNAGTNLLKAHKEFKWFVKGGPGDKLPAYKRESIFVGLIEGIHPEDAKHVIAMINKQKPKGITKKLVEEALPGLLDS